MEIRPLRGALLALYDWQRPGALPAPGSTERHPMFEKSTISTRPKQEASVRLCLVDGSTVEGVVFLKNDERLIDLLNDHRSFFPLRRLEGDTVIVAKSGVVSMVENPLPLCDMPLSDKLADEPKGKSTARKAFDPYTVLKVEPEASLVEIRAAYKMRMKAVHPDALASLDLDDDIRKAADAMSQRVNVAYQKILRERNAAANAGADYAGDATEFEADQEARNGTKHRAQRDKGAA